MNRLMQEDDWQWADLLAAAEAVTEEEYEYAAASREPVAPTVPEDGRRRLIMAGALILAEIERLDHAAAAPHTLVRPATPIEEDARDAARYRWLRARHWSEDSLALVVTKSVALRAGGLTYSRERLDVEIDIAMAQGGQSADGGILDGTNRTSDGTIGQP